jgi:hypothetical protein
VALAIRLTRRGLHCPDVRCEGGHQLDLDAPCNACAFIANERVDAGDPDHGQARSTEACIGPLFAADAAMPHGPTARRSSGELQDSALGYPTAATAAQTKPNVNVEGYGALARRLLRARTSAEREAIFASHDFGARGA